MATIPELRVRLHAAAVRLNDPGLFEIVDELHRRPPKHKAPVTSARTTPELYAEIRAFVAENPDLSRTAVGNIFNVNSGRVSEAVRGERT